MPAVTALTATDPSTAPSLVARPRLFADATRLARLRARWNDPAYASIVNLYKGKTDAFSLALTYLATGDTTAAHSAVTAATAIAYSLYTSANLLYADAAAFVLDWCYPVLTAGEKTSLISLLEANSALRETAVNAQFQLHEAHYTGFHAYLIGQLAIEGEAGATSRLPNLRNAVGHYLNWQNEVQGDGAFSTYSYQDLFFMLPPITWGMATNQKMASQASYLVNRADVVLRLLAADASNMQAGVGNQASQGAGMLEAGSPTPALAMYVAADYLRDGLSQYAGNRIKSKQGWSNAAADPQWLALMFYDDTLAAIDPVTAGSPLVKVFPNNGFANFRASWNPDVQAWYLSGPVTIHGNAAAGHITIWRGDDDLIVGGANYFGSPAGYKTGWEQYSFSRNCLVFSPIGSPTPDKDGSQILTVPQPASNNMYPWSNNLIWYPNGGNWASGRMGALSDDGVIARVVGDLSLAYNPSFVPAVTREVIYVRPNVFIIRDRFTLNNVGRVRANFFSRVQPQLTVVGQNHLAGSAYASSWTKPSAAIINRGASKATIQVLSPAATLTAIGGAGYEQWIDGQNIDPATQCQTWLLTDPRLAKRLARVVGQWRTEIEVPATSTEIITAITITGAGTPAPVLSLTPGFGERTISVNDTIVHLPN